MILTSLRLLRYFQVIFINQNHFCYLPMEIISFETCSDYAEWLIRLSVWCEFIRHQNTPSFLYRSYFYSNLQRYSRMIR